jgi:hypothetical protein
LYHGASTTEATVTLTDSIDNYRMISVRGLWYSNFRSAHVYDVDTFRNLKTKQRLYFENNPDESHYIECRYVSDTQCIILTTSTTTNIQIVGIR